MSDGYEGCEAPTMFTFNGIGTRLYGSRDERADGTYIATLCFCFIYVPLIPLRSYRVAAAGGNSYYFLEHAPLSGFARGWRTFLIAAVVLGIVTGVAASVLHDPNKGIKRRYDRALAMEKGDDPEKAIEELEAALDDGGLDRVGDRAEKAGAAIVRLAASLVPTPFRREHVDQAHRVVLRYQGLPDGAQGGKAREEMVNALEGWIAALGAPGDREARLVLLGDGDAIGGGASFAERIASGRRELATELVNTYPLDALAVMVGEPRDPELLKMASPLLDRLVESPSLLADGGDDIDTWLAQAAPGDALRAKVEEAKSKGAIALGPEQLTAVELTALQKERPWDQHVAFELANFELVAGKAAAAEKRLTALGSEGWRTREVNYALAQIAAGDGRLELADELLSRQVRSRMQRFVAARTAFDTATDDLNARLELRLRTGQIPSELNSKLDSASDEEGRALVDEWVAQESEKDEKMAAARARYFSYGDVVRTSLTAGTVKLRRAQGMSGAARDAMLADAERMFLAIRAEAEGEPEFHLGLGEVYARLGKTAESDTELNAILERKDPVLSLQVVEVYRGLGSYERAATIATQVYDESSDTAVKRQAAALRSLTAIDDDERRSWLEKADPKDPWVKTSLLEIDGRIAHRQGKHEECDRAFAKAAAAHLQLGNLNNAALAHQERFFCSGDRSALVDAETTLEKAYRKAPDDAVVVTNLASMLELNVKLRIVARRVDVELLRLDSDEVEGVFYMLVAGSERDKVLAELAADPGQRHALEILAQAEVLAPNLAEWHSRRIARATVQRDVAAMKDALERLRAAKNLDLSTATTQWQSWLDGEMDAHIRESADATIERAEAAAADKHADSHTRAVAYLLAAGGHRSRAQLGGDPKEIVKSREELVAALDAWSALPLQDQIGDALLDEAGLGADSARWAKERRERGGWALLDRLVAAKDPLADAIRASKPWGQIARYALDDTTRPGLDDWRLARLLGDATLMERAKPVLADELTRHRVETEKILRPYDPEVAEDFALLE